MNIENVQLAHEFLKNVSSYDLSEDISQLKIEGNKWHMIF
jgi:hypothetical protein